MASAPWPAPKLFAGGLPPAGGEKDPLYRPLQRTRRGGAGQASGDDRAVVIGVGGGALLDSAKVLARRLGGTAGGHPDYRRHLRGVDAAVGVV